MSCNQIRIAQLEEEEIAYRSRREELEKRQRQEQLSGLDREIAELKAQEEAKQQEQAELKRQDEEFHALMGDLHAHTVAEEEQQPKKHQHPPKFNLG